MRVPSGIRLGIYTGGSDSVPARYAVRHGPVREPRMITEVADPLRIALDDAGRELAGLPQRFIELFGRGDLTVELYAPRGTDGQSPHDQDEIYIVASGSGVFRRGADHVPFACGDLLFVAAGVEHRFESFTGDFRTWVIFFGPKGGY